MLTINYPVEEKYSKITSPFGGKPRELTIDGKKERQDKPHQGIDFKCPIGTKVLAVSDGAILKIGYQDENNHKIGLGLRIMQEFEFEDERYIACYGHLSGILVQERDRVLKGQAIGLSGNTGHTEGPHLHVQFRKLNTNVWIDAKFI